MAERAMRAELLSGNVKVICAGLRSFLDDLRAQGVESVGMEFRPRAGGDAELLRRIERLRGWGRG